MRFPQDFIDKVRDATNIVDIISQYTQLRLKGHRATGLCPFPDHNEKTPSFHVSVDRQLYHCFGCKKGGNVFTFLETYLGLGFVEAVEYLARWNSLALPEAPASQGKGGVSQRGRPSRQKKSEPNKKWLLRINELAQQYFREQFTALGSQHFVRDYVKKRNLSPALIEQFGLGWAPEEWEGLTQYLQSRNVPMELAEHLGLVKKRNQRDGYFDVYRGRLVFPIRSLARQLIGFGGRSLSEDGPKYLNSRENSLFHKGKEFYGLEESNRYIRSADTVLVVEGYMDFLALFGAGLCPTVATLGTALTADHARKLGRFTRNIVLLFDGDEAGVAAAERSLPVLLAEGLLVKGIQLPESMDPDDYIQRQGVSSLEERIQRAPDLFLVYLQNIMQEYKGQVSDKVRVLKKIAPLLLACKDQALQRLYMEEVAQTLAVKFAWVQTGLEQEKKGASAGPLPEGQRALDPYKPRKNGQTSRQPNKNTQEYKIALEHLAPLELELIRLILKKESHLQQFLAEAGQEMANSTSLRKLLQIISDSYRQNPGNFAKLSSLVVSKVDSPEKITHSLGQQGDEKQESKHFSACFRRLKIQKLIEKERSIAAELKIDPSPEKLEQFVNIQKERQSLANE